MKIFYIFVLLIFAFIDSSIQVLADGLTEEPERKEARCILRCFCPKDKTKSCGFDITGRCRPAKTCWKGLVSEYYQKIICDANCVHHCYKSDVTSAPSAVTVAPPTMTSGGRSNCILGCLCPDELNGTCHVGKTEPCYDRYCWKKTIKARFAGIKMVACCIHDNCIVGGDTDMHDTCSKLEKEATKGQQHGAKSAEDKSSGLITSGIIQTAMILLLQIPLY